MNTKRLYSLLVVIALFSALILIPDSTQADAPSAAPTLAWNTFLGSASNDSFADVATDQNGNVYGVGYSGDTWGNPVNAYAGGGDALIAKLNADGGLVWNTFLGSPALEQSFGIAVDESGYVYVVGQGFATWGNPVNAYTGEWAGFVAKLDNNGVLQWNTFLGSAEHETLNLVVVDKNGYVYVVGSGRGTWGDPVNPYSGGADTFVAKLSSNGALLWHTFLGSSSEDESFALAVDEGGNVYLTGHSFVSWGNPVNAHAGGERDILVAMLNSNGVLQWNTFLGSADYEYASGITLDAGGNIFITGVGNADWGNPVNHHTGGFDTVVAKLNNSGELQWNTFLGGGGFDMGQDIKLDQSGNILVVGNSHETWGAPTNPLAGGQDVYLALLNNSGELQWNTFMGCASGDGSGGLAHDGNGNVYVVGHSDASWESPLNPFTPGDAEAFVAKFEGSQPPANQPPVADAGGPYTIDEGSSITLDASGSSDPDNNIALYEWDLDNDGSFETAGQQATFNAVDGLSNYIVSVRVTDEGGLFTLDSATVTVNNVAPTVNMLLVSPEPSTEGQPVTASATFSDPGPDAPFACTVNYGDGSGDQPGTISDNICTGPAHTFTAFGAYPVTISVKDKDNGIGSSTATHGAIFNWAGFFQPVDNVPTLNVVNAGRAIPIKFSLGGYKGLNILAPGYPASQRIACSTQAPTDNVEETVAANNSSLSYNADSGQYDYVWKTDKVWAGSCRQLVMKLIDGTSHVAIFKFK